MNKIIAIIILLVVNGISLADTKMTIQNNSNMAMAVTYAICHPKIQTGVIRITHKIYNYPCPFKPIKKTISSNGGFEIISVPDDMIANNGKRIHYLLKVIAATCESQDKIIQPLSDPDCVVDKDNNVNSIILTTQAQAIICKSATIAVH